MCLESLQRHFKNEDIIVVDDGSDEESTKKFIDSICVLNVWKYIRNEKSVGHSRACEQGIEVAQMENLFLLNSDTIVTENGLKILDKVLRENKDIAVVGPKTSSATGPQLSQEAYVNRFVWTIDQIEQFAKHCEKLEDDFSDLDLICGFCFGIKKSIFVHLNGFDQQLSCYGNEKELLIRVRKAGYRTVFVPRSYVHHFGKMSYVHENINIARAQKDADRLIFKKHGLR
jgi:GT2 family glycosyltransferase